MQIKNTWESDSALCNRSVQKNKHQNSEDKNVHKFITCSFEHVIKQDHAMQLNQWLNAENQINM